MKITITLLLTLTVVAGTLAQELSWQDGTKVKRGDSLQLAKPTLGRDYAYVKYKEKTFLGTARPKQELSGEYEGRVLTISSIREGVADLRGLSYLVLTCDLERAILKGEIKKFNYAK